MQLMGAASSVGINVNENNATTLSSVWACIRILGNFMGMPPFSVYYRDKDGNRFKDRDHPLQHLLHDEPNRLMSSFFWRSTTEAHATLWGNGYSIIHRDKYEKPGELELVDHPTKVTPFIYQNELWYDVKGYNLPIRAADMFHIAGPGFNGIQGKSVLSMAAEAIGAGLAQQEFTNRFYANGSSMDGVLKTAQKLNPDIKKRLEDDWAGKYSGLNKSHKTVILEAGLDYQRIGIPPVDAQFIQSKEFTVEEIARFFNIQPHKISLLKDATYTNIEHQAMEFITDTMMPRYTVWEQEANRKLFTAAERGKYYTKFNTTSFLRGDAKARAMYFRIMTDAGIITINEARDLEDMNRAEDGDMHLVQLNRTDLKNLKNQTVQNN